MTAKKASPGADEPDRDRQTVRATTRALAILSALQSGGRALTELAESVNLSVPTAARLLRTLEDSEYVRRTGDGRYRVGPAVLRLAYTADTNGGARWLVRRGLESLRAEWDETCTFSILDGTSRMCIEVVESTRPIRWVVEPGTRSSLHLGAAGKIILAFGPTETLLKSVPLENGGFALANGRMKTIDDLSMEIEEIRQTRVATSNQETTPDSWGVAAPVFVGSNLLGAIGIAIPTARYTPTLLRRLMRSCAETAESLSSTEDQSRIGRVTKDNPARN